MVRNSQKSAVIIISTFFFLDVFFNGVCRSFIATVYHLPDIDYGDKYTPVCAGVYVFLELNDKTSYLPVESSSKEHKGFWLAGHNSVP